MTTFFVPFHNIKLLLEKSICMWGLNLKVETFLESLFSFSMHFCLVYCLLSTLRLQNLKKVRTLQLQQICIEVAGTEKGISQKSSIFSYEHIYDVEGLTVNSMWDKIFLQIYRNKVPLKNLYCYTYGFVEAKTKLL